MAGSSPNCLDCGDWIVVAFLFAFATVGGVYVFSHPDPVSFTAYTGTLGVSGSVFHWLRVRDQKIPDADH